MGHFNFKIITLTGCLAALLLFSCQEDTIEPEVFGSLTGEVLLEADNSAIADATVSTNPPTSTVQTDNQGRFTFDQIKTGTYSVRAEKSGLVTAVESITIYEDKTASVILTLSESDDTNTPPTAPANIEPANASTDLNTSLTLQWSASDEDGDALTYDVYLFQSTQNPNTLIASEISDTSLVISDLKYGTTYFWQVVASDGKADPVYGEVWSFSTQPFPNHPFVFAKVNNGKYDIFAAQSGNPALPLYQLTDMPGSNFRPRISPTGSRIAFFTNNFLNTEIYTMNRDGSDAQLVPAPIPVDGNDKFQLDFCWSPDGTKLLFMNENRLYKINLDGSGFELFAELTGNEEFVEVDWAAVTGKIAARTVGSMPYDGRILLYDDGGALEQVLVPDLPGNIGGPSFSIDGSAILYTRDLDALETPDGRQLNAHIFLKNIASGTETDLSIGKPLGFNDLDPKFSPNGAQVIFTHTNNVPGSQKDIYVMNSMGQSRLLLFENAEMGDWK